ncbi:MAG: ABC transporter ATP-binding protein [Burkholderiaceae bacterium]|nr:ABC transporter ATP-binding protein [Burkholderiaceae bacterium]
MLEIRGLRSGYGPMNILHDVSLRVDRGEVVCILGANGAGKSTLLRTVSGLLPVRQGEILFDGSSIGGQAPERIVRLGLAHVPEGREIFGALTVAQNLRLGAYAGRLRDSERDERKALVFELFPVLEAKQAWKAASLSGGEQQMVAVGRALMSGPRLLLLDEPSLGLSPRMTMNIFAAIGKLRELDVPVLLVEQNASAALRRSDRAYVLEHGKVSITGTADELLRDDAIQRNYLGL